MLWQVHECHIAKSDFPQFPDAVHYFDMDSEDLYMPRNMMAHFNKWWTLNWTLSSVLGGLGLNQSSELNFLTTM